jgi:hypothetical protein
MAIRVTTILAVVVAGLAILGAVLGWPAGRETDAARAAAGLQTSASPEAPQTAVSESPAASDAPVPAWVLDEARRLSRMLDDPHPDAAYWGLVPVGSLEALLENEWPDPTLTTYVIVLVGDFSTATMSRPAGAQVPERVPVAVTLYSSRDRSLSGFSLLYSGKSAVAIPTSLHAFAL